MGQAQNKTERTLMSADLLSDTESPKNLHMSFTYILLR